MATVTVTVTAGAQTSGRVRTIDNTVLATRFIPGLRKVFGLPNATDADVILAWADKVLRDTLDQIKAVEVAAATPVITDVPLT